MQQSSSYVDRSILGEPKSFAEHELTSARHIQQRHLQGLHSASRTQQPAAGAGAGAAAWAGFGATPSCRFSPDSAGAARPGVLLAPGCVASSSRPLHHPASSHGTFQHSKSHGHMYNSRSPALASSHEQPVNNSEILGLNSPRAGSPPMDTGRLAQQNIARGLAVARIMDTKASTSSRSISSVGSKSSREDGPRSLRSPSPSSRQLELQPWQIQLQITNNSSMATGSEDSWQMGPSKSSKLRSTPAGACEFQSAKAERLLQAVEGAPVSTTPHGDPAAAPAAGAAAAAAAPLQHTTVSRIPPTVGSGNGMTTSASQGRSLPSTAAVEQQAAAAVTVGNGNSNAASAGNSTCGTGLLQQLHVREVAGNAPELMTKAPPAAVDMQASGSNVQQQHPAACTPAVKLARPSPAGPTPLACKSQQRQVQVAGSQAKAASTPRGIFACCFGGGEAAVKDNGAASPPHVTQAPSAAVHYAPKEAAGIAGIAAGTHPLSVAEEHAHPADVTVQSNQAPTAAAGCLMPAAAQGEGGGLQRGDNHHRTSEVWGVAEVQESAGCQQQKDRTKVADSSRVNDGYTIKAIHSTVHDSQATINQLNNCTGQHMDHLHAKPAEGYCCTFSAGSSRCVISSSLGGTADASNGRCSPTQAVTNSNAVALSRRMSSGRRFSRQGSRTRHTADSVFADSPAQYPVLFTAPTLATQSKPAEIPNSTGAVSPGRDLSAAAAVEGWLQSSSTALPGAALSSGGGWCRRQSTAGTGSSPAQTGPAAAADCGSSTRSTGTKKAKRIAPAVTGWTTMQQQQPQGWHTQQQQRVSEKRRAAERNLAEQHALLKQRLEALRLLRSRSPSPLRGSELASGPLASGMKTRSALPASRAVAAGGRTVTPPRANRALNGSSTAAAVTRSAVTVGDLLVSPNGSRRTLMISPRAGAAAGGSCSSSGCRPATPPRGCEADAARGRLERLAGISKKELQSAAESLLQSLQDGTPMAPDALASLLSAVNDPAAAAAAEALAASTAAAEEVAAQQQRQSAAVPGKTDGSNSSSLAKKKPFVLVLPGSDDGAAGPADANASASTHGRIASAGNNGSHHAISKFKVPTGLLSLNFTKKSSRPPSQQGPKTYRAFYRNPALSSKGGAVVKYSSFRVGANLLQPRPPNSPKFILISPNSRFNSRRIIAGLNSTTRKQVAAAADLLTNPGGNQDDAAEPCTKGLGVVSGRRGVTNSSAGCSLRSQNSFAVSGEFTADAADEETAGTAAPNLASTVTSGHQSPAGIGMHRRSKILAAASPKQPPEGATAAANGSQTHRATSTTANRSASPNKVAMGTGMHAAGATRSTSDVAKMNKAAAAAGKQQVAGNSKGTTANGAASRRATAGDAVQGRLHMTHRASYLQFLKQQIGQADAVKTSHAAADLSATAVAAAAEPTQPELQQGQQQQQLEQLMQAASRGPASQAAASGQSPNALDTEAAARHAATEIAAQAIRAMLNMAVGGSYLGGTSLQDLSFVNGCSFVSDPDTPSAAAARAAAEAAVAAVSAAADARAATVKAEADAALLAAISSSSGNSTHLSSAAAAATPDAIAGGASHASAAVACQQRLLQQQQPSMYLPPAAVAAAQLPADQFVQTQAMTTAQGSSACVPQLAELKWEKAVREEQQRLQEYHLKQQMLMQNQQQELQIQLLQQQLALLQQQQLQQQSGHVQNPQLASMPQLQDLFQPQSASQQQSWQALLSPSQVSPSPKSPLNGPQPLPLAQHAWQRAAPPTIDVQATGMTQARPQVSPRMQPAGLTSPSKAASFKSKAATPVGSPGRAAVSGASSVKYASTSGRPGMRGNGSFKC